MPDDLWAEYHVHLPRAHSLEFTVSVEGQGTVEVFLLPGNSTSLASSYFEAFSTSGPVSEFSATFPPDFGFDKDYVIMVNTTSQGQVDYSMQVRMPEAPTGQYVPYYVLGILGLVGLVAFSWWFVVRQDRKEREARIKRPGQRPGGRTQRRDRRSKGRKPPAR